MAIGPVQLVVLGFSHPQFHGDIVAELERLRESDTVRVIDALAVHKDGDDGQDHRHEGAPAKVGGRRNHRLKDAHFGAVTSRFPRACVRRSRQISYSATLVPDGVYGR